MIIKQISIFIENKPGRLAGITDIIAENNINMRALVLAESTNFGILRIIADEPDKAEQALKDNEMRKLEMIEQNISKAIHTAVGISAKVKLVEPASIAKMSEVGKAKRVIDKRNLK